MTQALEFHRLLPPPPPTHTHVRHSCSLKSPRGLLRLVTLSVVVLGLKISFGLFRLVTPSVMVLGLKISFGLLHLVIHALAPRPLGKGEYGAFPAGSRALVPSNGGTPRGGLEVREQVSRALCLLCTYVCACGALIVVFVCTYIGGDEGGTHLAALPKRLLRLSPALGLDCSPLGLVFRTGLVEVTTRVY